MLKNKIKSMEKQNMKSKEDCIGNACESRGIQ